jgi:G3E family GTPase
MNPTRFLLLGGFLGSGKTTALLRLARHFVAAGKRVRIIANDQAENLVDTETLRNAGFPVEEGAWRR